MRKYKQVIVSSLLAIMLFISNCSIAQRNQKNNKNKSIISFYNLENLFDAFDDSLTNDNDFTPTGYKAWNSGRLNSKIIKLAKIIIAMGEFGPPDILGICEVENSFVIRQLLEKSPLKNWDLSFIHEDSKDRRGIDVALIYNPSSFEPLNYKYQKIDFNDTSTISRDILLVKGVLNLSDTIHLFINHWPSRYGGYMNSEWKRLCAANCMKAMIDSISKIEDNPGIIISGDFNDDPESPSMKVLVNNNYWDKIGNKLNLINLRPCNENLNKVFGTIKYNSSWHTFDQFVVSENFVKSKSGSMLECKCMNIFVNDYLIQPDKRFGGFKLIRTFEGARYLNGFSDHLPVSISIIYEE